MSFEKIIVNMINRGATAEELTCMLKLNKKYNYDSTVEEEKEMCENKNITNELEFFEQVAQRCEATMVYEDNYTICQNAAYAIRELLKIVKSK